MKDYLIHYGVPGMKCGVRKSPQVSSSRQAYKQAKKDYSRAYHKAYNYSTTHPIRQNIKGSKWKAESQRRWTDAIDKAEAVRNARKDYKQTKNRVKVENYRDKLAKRSGRYEKYNIDSARSENNRYKDIKRYGRSSKTWQDHLDREWEDKTWDNDFINRQTDRNKAVVKKFDTTINNWLTSDADFNQYVKDIKVNRDAASRRARQWAKTNRDLQNMKIDELTTKKDVRKVYRDGH